MGALELCGPAGLPDDRPSYERRRAEATTLHRVVRENIKTFYAMIEEGLSGASLPKFVRGELDGYLDCGLITRGFALLKCENHGKGCKESRLVAFACHGRGFCPSCAGRRMAQNTANLMDHVLPQGAALRQWVLTLPFELRVRLAYDGPLLGAVTRLFVDSVLRWYRRRLRAEGHANGQGGAFTVVQRSSSDLRLNPHAHLAALDGVFVEEGDGQLRFHALPRLKTEEVADLLQVIRVRILRFLIRREVVVSEPEWMVVDDGLSERDPFLAQLASSAVHGLPPAGPAIHKKTIQIPLRGKPGMTVSAPLSVSELGFSLNAATRAGAHDERGKEALIKYILRPPIANERLKLLPDGLVRIELKRPFSDGTTAIDMDPLSLISRLCGTVPPPRKHTIIYAGVLAPASKWRPRLVPPLPAPPEPLQTTSDETGNERSAASGEALPRKAPKPAHRCRYVPWIELVRRSFGVDLRVCEKCGGRMRLHAMVKDPVSIRRILRHLGEPTESPPISPARGPPYYKTVIRKKPPSETEMFE